MTLSTRAAAAPLFWTGVVLMLAANVLLPLQDALSKRVLTDGAMPIAQLLFLRSLTVLALMLAIGRTGLLRQAAGSRLKRAMTARSLLILGGWVAFAAAIRDLPLAQATTIYFASPIIVTLAAGPVLGERVGAARWAAVAVGFAGVCLASGLAGFTVSGAALLALLSTVLWAAALLMLRAMARSEPSAVQVLFANGVFVLAMAPLVLSQPFAAGWPGIVAAVLVGLVGGAGQLALYEAARHLSASLVATLEYGAILSGFALGFLMFGETPTLPVALGALLVLASGIAAVLAGDGPPAPGDPIHRQPTKELPMSAGHHDHVVAVIARTRFPFPGQPHWPADYVTLTNVPARTRSIPTPAGEHFPDIVILDGTGRVREIGEVEMSVDAASLPHLKAGSLAADDDTGAKVRHFFLYVPAGEEAAAQALLEANGVSYAGVRGFTVAADGGVGILPFVTPGDAYDHQATAPQPA